MGLLSANRFRQILPPKPSISISFHLFCFFPLKFKFKFETCCVTVIFEMFFEIGFAPLDVGGVRCGRGVGRIAVGQQDVAAAAHRAD